MGHGTPIEKVEVQVNGSAWQPARLDANRNPYSWTFWSLEIDPSRRLAPIASRATDRLGRTQPPDLSMKSPTGRTMRSGAEDSCLIGSRLQAPGSWR